MKKFDELTLKYKEEALETLRQYVNINSIYDEHTISKDKPFGEGVDKALEFIANLGKSMGFKIDRCDGYCTELSYGEGKLIDIYAHSDVVPVSNTWKTDPFNMVIEGDKMIGRGTCDDKGPGISALYAVKTLIDNNLVPEGVKIRVIFGGNEERGSACLDYYFNTLKKEFPTFGFTPDADFPLIYAEKAISNYEVEYDVELKHVNNFSFGEATNIVLDKCSVNITSDPDLVKAEIEKYLDKYKDTGIKITYDNYQLSFEGHPAHGSLPWIGCNAGLHLINFLGHLNKDKTLKNIYENYWDGTGKNFKGDYKSKYFKDSSYCIGLMRYQNKRLHLTVNMRLPENITCEKAIANIKDKTKPNKIEVTHTGEALLVDPNSTLVTTLVKVYQENTGDYESEIMAIGGGTYAKESKNTIAFGPTFKNREFHIHEDGEFFLISDFIKCMSIYASAVYELALRIND